MDDREHTPAAAGATPTGAARVIAAVFGIAFGGIGLTVLSFLWLGGDDGFGAPPLVFRLVGSFIALVFVAFGGVALYGAVTGRAATGRASGEAPRPAPAESGPPPGYRCPNCGAPLGQAADVSPMGDVRCAFCKTWFNVHGRKTA